MTASAATAARGVASFLALTLLASCSPADLSDRELTGLTKGQITEELGAPDQTQRLTKTTEFVFGPMESLWDELEMDEALEVWTYESTGGRKELYFLPNSDRVAGEFFWYDDPAKNPVF